jgi:hypothetical protein
MRYGILLAVAALVLTGAAADETLAQTRFFGHLAVVTIPCHTGYRVAIRYLTRHPACPLSIRYFVSADGRRILRQTARERGVRRVGRYGCSRPWVPRTHLTVSRAIPWVLYTGQFTTPRAGRCRIVVQFSRWVDLIEVKAYTSGMSHSSSPAGDPSTGSFCLYAQHRPNWRTNSDPRLTAARRHAVEQICLRSGIYRLPPEDRDRFREPPRSPLTVWPRQPFPRQPFPRRPNRRQFTPNQKQ